MSPAFHNPHERFDVTVWWRRIAKAGFLYLATITLAYAAAALIPSEHESLPLFAGVLGFGGCAAVVGVAYLNLKQSERTRERIIHDGQSCIATVLSKREELIGLGFGGGNVKMFVRLRIDREPPDAALDFESEVDDLVYHRATVGGTIGVKIIYNEPQVWVLDDPRKANREA